MVVLGSASTHCKMGLSNPDQQNRERHCVAHQPRDREIQNKHFYLNTLFAFNNAQCHMANIERKGKARSNILSQRAKIINVITTVIVVNIELIKGKKYN